MALALALAMAASHGHQPWPPAMTVTHGHGAMGMGRRILFQQKSRYCIIWTERGYGVKKILHKILIYVCTNFSALWNVNCHQAPARCYIAPNGGPVQGFGQAQVALTTHSWDRKKRAKTFKLGIQIILSKQKNILEKNLIGMCIVFMGIVLGDLAKFTNYLHIS